MDGRLAEREAIEASGVMWIELSGVGYPEESEEKEECSDMAVEGGWVTLTSVSAVHLTSVGVGMADSSTWRGG